MNRIKHSRLKGIIYVLISIFLLFSIAMTGFRVYGLNQNMIDTQQIHDNLQKEKEELAKEVNNLSSKEYQVRYARENYEFKAEDDTVIRLPK